jgi:hypothetical protein
MKRFLVATLAILATLALAFWIEGGKFSLLFFISPFLITFVVPCFAVLAVWDLKAWGRAWRDAFHSASKPGNREDSARLWDFYEKICYAAGAIAFIVGCVIILSTQGMDDAKTRECYAVNLIAPLYSVFFAIMARILRYRVMTAD